MQKRIYNFSAGPAILPEEVLLEAQENLFALPGVGMSILEISHRSKTYDEIHLNAKNDLKELLGIPDTHEVLFLQGGASLQFSMVALNLMPPANKADYIVTGTWSKKAVTEAKRVGTVNIAASTQGENFVRVPTQAELQLDRSGCLRMYAPWPGSFNRPLAGALFLLRPSSPPLRAGQLPVALASSRRRCFYAIVSLAPGEDPSKRLFCGLPVKTFGPRNMGNKPSRLLATSHYRALICPE